MTKLLHESYTAGVGDRLKNDGRPNEKSPGNSLASMLDEAWRISRRHHGNELIAYVPGMFVVDGRRGRYRAVSITATKCELDCEHCKGVLLKTMPQAAGPEDLLRFGLAAAERGDHGILVTGGCDSEGRLPWERFVPVIERLVEETNLVVTVHAGQIDLPTARLLKGAGVSQALVDVIGDDLTAREVYHLPDGTLSIRRTMESLAEAGLEIAPHIVFGIHYGMERGERNALEMLKEFPINKYVIVVLMPFRGTPMEEVLPPSPEEVARFIALCRLEMPKVAASLGCARPRGKYRRRLDLLAVRAGVNSMAIPSDAALDEAHNRGLTVRFAETCCSLWNGAGEREVEVPQGGMDGSS